MSDQTLSDKDAEGTRALREKDPERQAIAEALGGNRRKVLIGAWAVTCIHVFLVVIALSTRDIPHFYFVALSVWSLCQVGLSVSLHLVPQRYIYRVVITWLSLIGALLTAQISVFYFGPERTAILNGTLPVLAITIPLVVVLAGTILKRTDALHFNLCLIVALMFITSLHAWLYWDEAQTHYAMLLMLLIVFLISPLTMLLQLEQRRLHSVDMRSLQRLAAAEHEASLRYQQEHIRDPLTHLLNRAGISEALEALLERPTPTAIGFLSISNAPSMRRQSGEFGYEDLICRAATRLQEHIGNVGRQDAADFVVWSETATDADAWQTRIDQLADTLIAELSGENFRPMITVGAGLYESGTLPAVALEDLSYRSNSAPARG